MRWSAPPVYTPKRDLVIAGRRKYRTLKALAEFAGCTPSYAMAVLRGIRHTRVTRSCSRRAGAGLIAKNIEALGADAYEAAFHADVARGTDLLLQRLRGAGKAA